MNGTSIKEEIAEGHQKTELLRAKQDLMNRIIQMGEKVQKFSTNGILYKLHCLKFFNQLFHSFLSYYFSFFVKNYPFNNI